MRYTAVVDSRHTYVSRYCLHACMSGAILQYLGFGARHLRRLARKLSSLPSLQYTCATSLPIVSLTPIAPWKPQHVLLLCLCFVSLLCLSEYDPLEPNRRAVKARVGRLPDPCSRVLDKRAEENGLLVDKGELCLPFRQQTWCFFLGSFARAAFHTFFPQCCCSVNVAGEPSSPENRRGIARN